MALADYYLCDRCGAKAFYDADLGDRIDQAGDLVALCKGCAVVYKCTFVPKYHSEEQP